MNFNYKTLLQKPRAENNALRIFNLIRNNLYFKYINNSSQNNMFYHNIIVSQISLIKKKYSEP